MASRAGPDGDLGGDWRGVKSAPKRVKRAPSSEKSNVSRKGPLRTLTGTERVPGIMETLETIGKE